MSDFNYREEFRTRLTRIRMHKGISARDMSLSLGMSEGYINKVENGKVLPSMGTFFEICDYLKITPKEFFDTGVAFPLELNIVIHEMNKLRPDQRNRIINLMKDINRGR